MHHSIANLKFNIQYIYIYILREYIIQVSCWNIGEYSYNVVMSETAQQTGNGDQLNHFEVKAVTQNVT